MTWFFMGAYEMDALGKSVGLVIFRRNEMFATLPARFGFITSHFLITQ